MTERHGVVVERLVDEGQWFEPGVRVEYFPALYDPRKSTLELAALGSYEVVDCERQSTNGQPWLTIRLRRYTES
jgi:hypothetical protein